MSNLAQVIGMDGDLSNRATVEVAATGGVVQSMTIFDAVCLATGRRGMSTWNAPKWAPAGTPLFEVGHGKLTCWVDAGGRFVHLGAPLGHLIELIQGTMQTLGGYRVDGVETVGEDAEALVDEAKEIAYATGRQVEVVLARLLKLV